jgi:hypothetical protein
MENVSRETSKKENQMFKFLKLLNNQRGEIIMSGGDAKLEDLPATPAAPAAPAPTPPGDTTGLSASQIKEKLLAQPKAPPAPEAPKHGQRIPVPQDAPAQKPEEAAPAAPEATTAEPGKDEPWYKQFGFKSAAEAKQSYGSAQEKIRQQAEEIKNMKLAEQSKVQQELERLRRIEQDRNLSPEEKTRQAAFENWEKENSDALHLIEKRLLGKLEEAYDIKPKAQAFEEQALADRKSWKDGFDKDPNRAALWPVMEQLYKEQDIFHGFAKNPFPFIEALAFQKNFAVVAERIRAEAVEQYKASVQKAEAAARAGKTELPGGAKAISGERDVASMTSRQIADLLPRSENG